MNSWVCPLCLLLTCYLEGTLARDILHLSVPVGCSTAALVLSHGAWEAEYSCVIFKMTDEEGQGHLPQLAEQDPALL